MSAAPGTMERKRFIDSTCGRVVAILLIAYGVVNTLMYIKFTPVYVATECGDQTAEMNNLELGTEIRVGLQIGVTCSNPNAYAVQVMTSQPGKVYVGRDRSVVVGDLSLVTGSTLPAKSSGAIRVHMDASLSDETSMDLVPHFLEDAEIPMYLELQFVVAVDVVFLGHSLGTTAPFKKKCGMMMAGVLTNSVSRLGPMICRESWDELGELPHVDAAPGGQMSFSAAQMDPDRIRMGEIAKNVSIIGVGGFCYIMGIVLICGWIASCCERRADGGLPNGYDKVGQPSDVSDSLLGRTMGFLLGLTPFNQGAVRSMTPFEPEYEGWEERFQQQGCNCLFAPMRKLGTRDHSSVKNLSYAVTTHP